MRIWIDLTNSPHVLVMRPIMRALERRAFTAAEVVPDIAPTLLAGIPSPRLVFVNGRHVAALSDTGALPDGVTLHVLDIAEIPHDLTPAMFASARVAGW
jgi:hypothetical protein